MKILIVEDEPSLREIMVRTLTREQYVVEQAADYAAALDKIAAYDYDCILLDIMLPGGSGLRLLEELKRRRSPAAVIIISARDSLDDKIEGLELGADDYLPKPFHLAELSARIRSVLRRHQRGGYESLDAGNVRLWPDSRRVEVAGRPPQPHGRQDRAGRRGLGRPYRPGRQFRFRLCADEEPAPQAPRCGRRHRDPRSLRLRL